MAETTAKYRVLIPVELGTAGVRSGEKELDNFYARLERRAAEAAKKVEEAMKRAGGTMPGAGSGGGRPSAAAGRAADDHVKQFREMERAAARSAGEVRRINEQTRRQADAQDRLSERSARQLATVKTREAKRAADDFLRLLDATTRAEKRAASERERAARSGGFFKAPSPIAAGIVGGLGIASITSDLINGGSALLSYSARLEQTRIGFTTLTGSVELANKHIRDLQEFAQKTPFQFEDVLTASRRFHAMGYETERVIPLLRAMGDAIAAVGGSTESINQVSRAFAQIFAKGRLQAEEANQIADATDGAVNAYAILAKQLGVTQAKAREMGEQGKITGEIFLDSFQAFARENFGGAMEKQSRTFLGAWNNIIDSLQIKGATALDPFFKSVSELTDRTAREIERQDFEGAIQTIIENVFKGAGDAAGDAVLNFVDELFDKAEKRADENAKNFNPMGWGARLAEGMFGLAPDETIFDKLFGDEKSVSEARRLMTEVVDFGNSVRVDPSTLRPAGRQSSLTLNDDPKLLDRQRDLIADLRREIEFFGDKSASAATRQKLLAAGVKDLNSGLAAQALQYAAVIDKMRDAADVAELTEKKLKEAREFQEDAGKQLTTAATEARRRARELNNETMGFKPSESFRFSISQLGQMGKSMETVKSEFADATQAFRELDEAAGNNEAFRKRKEAAENLLKAVTGFSDSFIDQLLPANTEFEKFLGGLMKLDGFKSTIGAAASNMRDLFEGFPEGTERARAFTAIFSKLITTANNGQGMAKLTADEVQRLAMNFGFAADAALVLDRQMRELNSPLGRAQQSLKEQLEESQAAIAVAAETAAGRYKLAWQDAHNEVVLADDAARVSMIQSQVRLADATVFHAGQANAAVLEYLASQRSVTEVVSDFRVNVISSTFDVIDRGLEKMTSRLGAVGSILKDLISGFIRLALNRAFQSMFGGVVGGQGGAQSSGGGFSFSNFLGGLFGGSQGASLTGGFAGGASPAAGILSGGGGLTTGGVFGASNPLANFFGGGISAPTSMAAQAAQQRALTEAIQQAAPGATQAGAAAPSALSFASFGQMLSTAGPLAAAAISVGTWQAALGGNIGPGKALLGGGLLGLGLSYIGRSRLRREEEVKRDALSNDTGTAIWQLIRLAQAGELGLAEAQQQFDAIKARYFQAIPSLRDSKTRRIATETWNHFQALWPTLEQIARQADENKKREAAFIPTFRDGGGVWRKFADGGFNGRVPGVYDRRDDKLIAVSGNEAVLTPKQWAPIAPYLAAAGVPGFDGGVGSGGGQSNVQLSASVTIHPDGLATVVVKSPLFGEAVAEVAVEAVSADIGRRGEVFQASQREQGRRQ